MIGYKGTYLYEVSQQLGTEVLLQDKAVSLVVIAAGNQGWKQDGGQPGMTEVLEW